MSELDRLNEVSSQRSDLLEFLQWMREQGYRIVEEKTYTHQRAKIGVDFPDPDNPDDWKKYEETDWYTKNATDDELVLAFFDIDPDQLEDERRALLEEIRS